MKMPRSYRGQDGCHNCALVFKKYEHDDLDTFYCAFRARTRPECGSVAMRECFLFDNGRTKWDHEAERRWDRWSEGREVDPTAICDTWNPEGR